jgi:hypothetical protein
MKIPITPLGFDPANFWFVVRCLNHCATACSRIRRCRNLNFCVVSTQLIWFRLCTAVRIIKAKLPWPTPWRHIQACRWSRVTASLIFNLNHSMEVSDQVHALVTLPIGKSPSTQWLERWEGSRAHLDVFAPAGIWTLDCSTGSLVTILIKLSWLLLPFV